MSGRDYAQVETRSHDVEPSPQGLKAIVLVVVLLALVAGTFAGGFWLGREQGKQTATGEDRARLEKQLKEQQQELAKLRQAAKQKVAPEVSTTQVGELTFYNELPHQPVVPAPMNTEQDHASAPAPAATAGSPSAPKPVAVTTAPDKSASMQQILAQELQKRPSTTTTASSPATSSPATPAVAAQPGQYLLQVGSFPRRQDAELFAVRFKSLGMPPLVRAAQLGDRGTWYRVYLGPFAAKADADAARLRVRKALKIEGLVIKGG